MTESEIVAIEQRVKADYTQAKSIGHFDQRRYEWQLRKDILDLLSALRERDKRIQRLESALRECCLCGATRALMPNTKYKCRACLALSEEKSE